MLPPDGLAKLSLNGELYKPWGTSNVGGAITVCAETSRVPIKDVSVAPMNIINSNTMGNDLDDVGRVHIFRPDESDSVSEGRTTMWNSYKRTGTVPTSLETFQ